MSRAMSRCSELGSFNMFLFMCVCMKSNISEHRSTILAYNVRQVSISNEKLMEIYCRKSFIHITQYRREEKEEEGQGKQPKKVLH